MSQKSITEALANNYWYGIEWDVTVNTSACSKELVIWIYIELYQFNLNSSDV